MCGSGRLLEGERFICIYERFICASITSAGRLVYRLF